LSGPLRKKVWVLSHLRNPANPSAARVSGADGDTELFRKPRKINGSKASDKLHYITDFFRVQPAKPLQIQGFSEQEPDQNGAKMDSLDPYKKHSNCIEISVCKGT